MPRRPASDACRHRLLARGDGHQITHCTCGSVHLTLANTTLRLTPEAFAAMAQSIARATTKIEPHPTTVPTTVH
ncbi:MAG: hypothetical protein NXI30_08715 [bacterium]|nr:hypothetical protein [bacterium]